MDKSKIIRLITRFALPAVIISILCYDDEKIFRVMTVFWLMAIAYRLGSDNDEEDIHDRYGDIQKRG